MLARKPGDHLTVAAGWLSEVLIAISVVGVVLVAVTSAAEPDTAPGPAAVANAAPPPALVDASAAPTAGPRLHPPPTAASPLPVATELIPPAPPDVGTSRPPSPTLPLVLDERFVDNRMGWPDAPQSTAWLSNGAYHMAARVPNRFVAVGAPLALGLHDVILTATFRKVGGPPGGGYGMIVRDQSPGARNGLAQGG